MVRLSLTLLVVYHIFSVQSGVIDLDGVKIQLEDINSVEENEYGLIKHETGLEIDIISQLIREEITTSHGQQRIKRAIEPVEQYASRMERLFGINHPTMRQNVKNSITQYTFNATTNARGLATRLPLVVRATIKPSDIQLPNSRPGDAVSNDAKTNCNRMGMNKGAGRNNDAYGHLIAFKNGGPSDFYNIVPQTTRINVGTVTNTDIDAPSIWYHSEMAVTDFVTQTQGYVKLVVAVFYEGSTRPSAFGVAESRYNLANVLVKRFPDYYYSNNPNEDPDVLNG